jgi:aminoglycoside phosphotransferase (APT) family kinase protein
MADPTPLASGRDADVYALDSGCVLRRYRDGGDVTDEAELMVHVGECGFPVPIVYGASGADLVLERLDGTTMLHALAGGSVGVEWAAATLADLHRRLHQVPPLRGAEPGDRILHLDLHPDNVILSSRGPVVIDWRNAREGPPDLDVALTAVILAQVAVDPAHSWAGSAGALLTAFLRSADSVPLSTLDAALARRRADRNVTEAELERLAAARVLVQSQLRPHRTTLGPQGR